jgi:hypothetical protein
LKIIILNGSPKSEKSVTMQRMKYLEQNYVEQNYVEQKNINTGIIAKILVVLGMIAYIMIPAAFSQI